MKTKFAGLVLETFFLLAVLLVTPLRAQFAYVANQEGNNVSAYSIGSNGALMPVPGSPFAADSGAVSVAVDPTGKFAYVANNFANNVSGYSIASNGALTPVPGSPFAGGGFSVAVDPTAQFVYVANGSAVSAYNIASNGDLTPVPGSPFAAAGAFSSWRLAVDPTGKFVYVTNNSGPPSGNTVSGYSIASNGALTPVPGSPFATGFAPYGVAVDPNGQVRLRDKQQR
jgi:6-phosphogluconolactonase (cycloisomerase 2 family)